ncbi:MAG: TIGR03619 family F420-dependent LLM class oxidoreductase [Chloroflexota bacterium]
MTPKIMLILSENWTITDGQDLRSLVDWAVIAEESGVDAVMLSEHISLGPGAGAKGREPNERAYMAPGNQDPATPWPDSLMLFSAIAARTTKIRLFAGAIIVPLRHPVHLAKQLATLDCLSEGRLIVQPTVSWHTDEYGHLGVDFTQRGKMLDEHLTAWQLLWSESPATFEGQFYQFEDCYVDPKPSRPGGPVLWFGGQSMHKALTRRLVDYGQGFHPFGAPSAEDIETLTEAMAAAGRDIDELEMIGGIRARFPDNDSPADLDEALESIPPQIEKGFTTFCVKPNQFIDDAAEMRDFCERLVAGFSKMSVE